MQSDETVKPKKSKFVYSSCEVKQNICAMQLYCSCVRTGSIIIEFCRAQHGVLAQDISIWHLETV